MHQKSSGKPGESKEESRDRLTGVLKKSAAEAQIASRMKEKRGGTLFLCDVDYIKRINEQYGHLMGDECLKQVARILSYMIRPGDILGRRSGDEFVIFMPDCQDMWQAQENCKRVRNRFRTKVSGRIPLSVTVVWALQKPQDTWRELLERADEEMGRQKAALEAAPRQSGKEKDRYVKDVRQVRKELMEQIQKPGAYCQDYETFKGIYRFLARGIIRSRQNACVILITVVNKEGGSPRLYEKDMLMEQLGENIGAALRIGDVYTRYSSSQYLLLVINTTESQADMIVERIRDQFLADIRGNDVLIHNCYELQPAQIGTSMEAEEAGWGPEKIAKE